MFLQQNIDFITMDDWHPQCNYPVQRIFSMVFNTAQIVVSQDHSEIPTENDH